MSTLRLSNPRRRLHDLRVNRAIIRRTRARTFTRALVSLGLMGAALSCADRVAHAQSVTVVGPPGTDTIRTATPRFTVRAAGFDASRPFQIVLQIATTADFSNGLLVDTTLTSNALDTDVQVTRVLPSAAVIFWRAMVSTPAGQQATSAVSGPRRLLPWLTLLSPTGTLQTRRPLFVWRSPSIVPAAGEWVYDFEVRLRDNNSVVLIATLRNDTTFIPAIDLQANASYIWSVRATAPNGEFVEEVSKTTFVISDPALPTTTILYQNFPNPFPTPASFSTCFWFDVGEPGARVALDILDLRGNLIRTIIPGDDRTQDFTPGRYGRGIPGLGNNCDNRFVWNGTGIDGRPVAPGAYLMRFVVNNGRPEFRTILYKGR